MEDRAAMGNCLPLLFPSLLRSEDQSSLEEVREGSSATNTSGRLEHSSYVNELWNLEANGERRDPEVRGEDSEKAHISAMLEQIPADTFKEGKMGDAECPICMVDFVDGDQIRYLPCMHCYHKKCADDWLMRSFSCPSCMEPVDSAMLSSFAAHTVRGLVTLACSPATSGTNHNPLPS